MSEESNLWQPESNRIAWQGNTLEEITRGYELFLEVRHPENLKQFRDRFNGDRDAAVAEAVMFSWLRAARLEPAMNEDRTHGGVDFLCLPGARDSFLLEVTNLRKDVVTKKSGWPDELDPTAAAFSLITPQISYSIQGKVPQLANGPNGIPRVLAVCLSHDGASVLLGTLAAEWVVTSEPKITIPLSTDGTPAVPARLVTDLKKSAFFCLKNASIVAARKPISAVLLVAVCERQLEVVGMLHPEPAVPFEYRLLPKVPFLQTEWPMTGEIHTQWVIGYPDPLVRHHVTITLTDDELKAR